jgi:hypothetical protein
MLPGAWGRLCLFGKSSGRKETGNRLRASPRQCRAFFRRLFCLGRLVVHSCPRRRASPSIRIGLRIQFARIVWRGRLQPAAERLPVGTGASATTARQDYRLHSEYHPRLIENVRTQRVRVSAACADNLFIGSAGMLIYGSLGLTKMQSGTVPALSHGSSGMRQVVRPGSCAACKRVAAAKPADVFGRAPRLITASRYFGCGTSAETIRGRSCSTIGACRTFR